MAYSQTRLWFFAFAIVLVGGCATSPHIAEFSGSLPVEDCPDHLKGRISLSADVVNLASSPEEEYRSDLRTIGTLNRRVRIAATPSGLGRGDRIVWSVLSLSIYGGTFSGWTQLNTDLRSLGNTPASQTTKSSSDSRPQPELATVALSPGQIKITRVARAKVDLAGTVILDTYVTPGGVPVDNNVVRFSRLWADDQTPLSPGQIALESIPVRHPPGLDIVEATAELTYVILEASTKDEWVCSAQTSVTLVNKDDIRLPLWDLGLADENAGRQWWLAVFSESAGIVRLAFASSTEANALANWIQATGADKVGHYVLGVFNQPWIAKRPSFIPVDAEALKSFRPLTPNDIPRLRVGPLGEP